MRYNVIFRNNAGNEVQITLYEHEIDSYKSMGYKVISKWQA